jgi:hypothetical protein
MSERYALPHRKGAGGWNPHRAQISTPAKEFKIVPKDNTTPESVKTGPISADEAADWLKYMGLRCPTEEICKKLAGTLNRIMDPPPKAQVVIDHELNPLPEWWDFEQVATAAQILSETLPLMRLFIDSLVSTDEIKKQLEAISTLPDVLAAAMPFIQHPLGEFKKLDVRRKDWHKPAFFIALSIWLTVKNAGNNPPAVGNRTRIARVVKSILDRMGKWSTQEASTIGQYLDRRFQSHGLKTQHRGRQR